MNQCEVGCETRGSPTESALSATDASLDGGRYWLLRIGLVVMGQHFVANPFAFEDG